MSAKFSMPLKKIATRYKQTKAKEQKRKQNKTFLATGLATY